MMTFYIGKEMKAYEKKWRAISHYFAKEMELKGLDPYSKAAVFRYMVDKLYKKLNDSRKKEVA